MNDIQDLPEVNSNEEPYLTVALDGFIDGLYEADMALESVGNLRQLVLESPRMTKRELKFVRLTLECWQDHLNMPEQYRVSMEDSGDEQSDAIQETDGFFLKIWKAIKITFNWIINAVKGMFTRNEDKDKETSEKIKKASKNSDELAENMETKAKKEGKDVKTPSLGVLGIKGDSLALKDVNDALVSIQKNVEILKPLSGISAALMSEISEHIARFSGTPSAQTADSLKNALAKKVGEFENVFAKFALSTKEQAESMGTDPGKCYTIPVFERTVNIVVKVEGGDRPRFAAKIVHTPVSDATGAIDLDSYVKPELEKFIALLNDLNVEIGSFNNELRVVSKTMDKTQGDFQKHVDSIKATDPKVDNEFGNMVRYGLTLMAASTVLLNGLKSTHMKVLHVMSGILPKQA